MKTVLTIAGFDPSSGAGVTADLMVFAAHGLYGTSAITALTIQSTKEVRGSHPVIPQVLGDTLDCLHHDIPPAGIKIGMIGSGDNARKISAYIEEMKVRHATASPIILDTILVSSSGRELLDSYGIEVFKKDLLQLVDWVTPNADELSALTGTQVRSKSELAAAARILQAQSGLGLRGGSIGILAKGGHLDQPDDLLVMPDGAEHWLRGQWIETEATHGTGCALSSAFLSRLVLGDPPIVAAPKAKDYVVQAMRRAPGIGHGKGPMNLLWPLQNKQR